MNKLNFAIFMAGVTTGAAATWFGLKKHYERIAQEEIDSVKAVFAEHRNNPMFTEKDETKQRDCEKGTTKEDIEEAVKKFMGPFSEPMSPEMMEFFKNPASELDKMESAIEEIKENNKLKKDGPYIITPDEFAESNGYEGITLTYYLDDVLADDMDEIIEDADILVGKDFKNHFGEYENDAVYVRNDTLKCDYEILKDLNTYEGATGISPDEED